MTDVLSVPHDRVRLAAGMHAAFRAVRPADQAWVRLSQKAVNVWLATRVVDYVTPTGNPRTKGRQERAVDTGQWDLMRRILIDWPDHPIGAGTGSADLWMLDTAESLLTA